MESRFLKQNPSSAKTQLPWANEWVIFYVDFLPCSISLCNFQLYLSKMHITEFSPTIQLPSGHKLYHQTPTCKNKCRDTPDRAEVVATRRTCPYVALLSYLTNKPPRVYFTTECHFSRWPSLSGTTFCVLSWCQQSDSLSLAKPKPALLLQPC